MTLPPDPYDQEPPEPSKPANDNIFHEAEVDIGEAWVQSIEDDINMEIFNIYTGG